MTALNIIVIANYPFEKHYILASLVKGRWIDGKAQALILLLSACEMPNIFMLQTFLPSRRRDCLTSALCPTPTLPKPHYPLLCNITLASLVKGRWIDGKAQVLILLLSACDMPNIFMLQTFLPSRRRDCLISTASPYNTLFQNRTIPCFTPSPLPPLSKVRCCRPKKFGRLPEGLPHHYPSPLTNPSKTALSHA